MHHVVQVLFVLNNPHVARHNHGGEGEGKVCE